MRSFFCFELPEQVQEEISKTGTQIDSPAYVKWVSTKNLHITLKFLGDVDEDQLPKIKDRARACARQVNPFQFKVDQLGSFPNKGYPKVIWLGSEDPPPEIGSIQSTLEEEMSTLGFEKEDREYIPHITLGRTKDDDSNNIKQLGNRLQNFGFEESWQVTLDELTLMESQLKKGGPVYSPIFRLSLGE